MGEDFDELVDYSEEYQRTKADIEKIMDETKLIKHEGLVMDEFDYLV